MTRPSRKRGRKAPRRYGWTLALSSSDPRVRALSPKAAQALYYARKLAENAAERSAEALFGMPPERLTVEEFAFEDELSPITLRTWLKQLRLELFGRDLSDSAIYHRLRRERELARRAPRACAVESCELQLPANATARRRYCDLHAAPAARVRRHRANAKRR